MRKNSVQLRSRQVTRRPKMEGGNGVSVSERNYAFAVRRTKHLSRARTQVSRLAAVPCRIVDMTDNLFRRRTAPTRWIAAVSAAEETSREVRKVREVLKTMRSLRSLRLKKLAGETPGKSHAETRRRGEMEGGNGVSVSERNYAVRR